MTRKQARLGVVLLVLLGLGTATALTLLALDDNLAFFYAPSDVQAASLAPGQRFRLGGILEEGSVVRVGGSATVTFRVTDYTSSLPVRYTGILPDLFIEGQGVVATGMLGEDGIFQAVEILARHDESYMPREVAEAVGRNGMHASSRRRSSRA